MIKLPYLLDTISPLCPHLHPCDLHTLSHSQATLTCDVSAGGENVNWRQHNTWTWAHPAVSNLRWFASVDNEANKVCFYVLVNTLALTRQDDFTINHFPEKHIAPYDFHGQLQKTSAADNPYTTIQ